MRYVSTRGSAQALAFDEVLLAGLARDGGLYLPESWPRLSPAEIAALRDLPYAELAARLMLPFVGTRIAPDVFRRLVAEAYAGFGHPDVAPLVPLDEGTHLLELFHGPTLAFKDVAMQLLGRLLDHVLAQRGQRVTIVGATSGDTGSAAIEAVKGRGAIDIFMLHPHGRVSEVQRRQMTTVQAANVHNLAIDGTFDDCQDLVKACFNDLPFRDAMHLTAVNSINWARVMAQIVYYFWAALKLGAPERAISFTVPTGNFGNIYAGYAARQMGLPVSGFVIASNRNDILARFAETGAMEIAGVEASLSPSMDIQVSSNFERLLFDLYDRDGAALTEAMQAFRQTGRLALDETRMAAFRSLFAAARVDDAATLETIAEIHRRHGMVIDPHTAVGLRAARLARRDREVPMVVLATAHPAKFPDAVERAIGERPSLPPALADLGQRPERCARLANDPVELKRYIAEHAALKGAA